MLRLQSFSKTLVDELRASSAEKQRAAAVAACGFAISAAGPLKPELAAIYERVDANIPLTPSELALLETSKNEHDDRYFDLQDAGDPEHMKEFSIARALSALQFAAKADSLESRSEAIYEASCASDDKEKLLRAVRQALR